MFNRKIEINLEEWKQRPNKKPLVLRGARQTGKTTLIRKFAAQFDNFIELNLEKDAIQKIFAEVKDIRSIVQSIEGVTNKRVIPEKTLLFLDEIQNSISAIKLLRYFYEEMPGLHVISAGSLLEVRMKSEGWSFPVGRVEFLYLYPVSFEEFLSVMGEDLLLKALLEAGPENILPTPLHEKLSDLLADYMCVGGMPEAVSEFISSRSFAEVKRYHESLTSSFKEDFSKYSKGSQVEYLKQIWDKIPFEIGSRIKYSRICGPEARSSDVSRAFDVLHEAMLVERILPTTRTNIPLVKKAKAAPKALFLDIGLCTYTLNLTRDQLKERLMDVAYGGGLTEEFVGEELLALNFHRRSSLYFWTREEKGTTSELDYLIQIGNKIVPIEVKTGSHGSLKSLHQFLHRNGTGFGVRIYNGPLRNEIHLVNLPDGKKLKYQLLSIPYYLTFRLQAICEKYIF
jgi:hypothetical protein